MDKLRVLEFRGEMDVFAKSWIERKLDQLLEPGAPAHTILDLTRLRYIDTTFLNALIRVRNRLFAQGVDARVCLVAPRVGIVRRIFSITKLDTVFPIFDDLASARESASAELWPPLTQSA